MRFSTILEAQPSSLENLHLKVIEFLCISFVTPTLVSLALLGLATPDPVISSRVAHTQEAVQ